MMLSFKLSKKAQPVGPANRPESRPLADLCVIRAERSPWREPPGRLGAPFGLLAVEGGL